MKYTSTRAALSVDSAAAIISGISAEGGLFVPAEDFPSMPLERVCAMAEAPYAQRAAEVLGLYLTDYTAGELAAMCAEAYSTPRFDTARIAPLVPVGEGEYYLELYHGPTQAFKDMALQMLPRLLTAAAKKRGSDKETVILVATSGDTGKAALEGFRDVPGVRVIVFYPRDGVSPTQKLQMTTQRGGNVDVAAVEGNFDDAQTGVKNIFADREFAGELAARGFSLSSANSINFGRLVPQVAYYFSAYADLVGSGAVRPGDKVNFCVPTGNFGNILAAEYARRMGLPVGKLICASNRNDVLTDFINTGVYNANRPFHKTASPSMDILISSNVERLLYLLCGRDESAVAGLMAELKAKGEYTLPAPALAQLQEGFWAAWAGDEEAAQRLSSVWHERGYLMDTHTAVASAVAARYIAQTGDDRPMVVVSTASPYKFSASVLSAIGGKAEGEGIFAADDALEALTGVPAPAPLKELRGLPVIHNSVCPRSDMLRTVDGFLKK